MKKAIFFILCFFLTLANTSKSNARIYKNGILTTVMDPSSLEQLRKICDSSRPDFDTKMPQVRPFALSIYLDGKIYITIYRPETNPVFSISNPLKAAVEGKMMYVKTHDGKNNLKLSILSIDGEKFVNNDALKSLLNPYIKPKGFKIY